MLARRFARLRDELHRWEKVQIARRQRVLAQAILSAQWRIAQIRTDQAAAAGHLAELDTRLEGLRLELVQCETAARATRETAHTHEVDIGRLEQRIQNDEQQLASLGRRVGDLTGEIDALTLRRGPAADQCAARQQDVVRATQDRDAAAAELAAANDDQDAVLGLLSGLEADVEASRSEQFAAATAATAAARHRQRPGGPGPHLSRLGPTVG